MAIGYIRYSKVQKKFEADKDTPNLPRILILDKNERGDVFESAAWVYFSQYFLSDHNVVVGKLPLFGSHKRGR